VPQQAERGLIDHLHSPCAHAPLRACAGVAMHTTPSLSLRTRAACHALQEGKRTDWNEWSCVRVIQKEVGPCSNAGECNGGCPFKTLDEPKLRALLGRLNCGER
jgi:hypothetical protein